MTAHGATRRPRTVADNDEYCLVRVGELLEMEDGQCLSAVQLGCSLSRVMTSIRNNFMPVLTTHRDARQH